jgi:hypothetical protein
VETQNQKRIDLFTSPYQLNFPSWHLGVQKGKEAKPMESSQAAQQEER